MSAGRDVQEVVLLLRIEVPAAREVMQRGVHLFKVPRIAGFHFHPHDLGFRRDRCDVEPHALGQAATACVVDQFEAMHEKVLVLAQRNRGPPFFPAPSALAAEVEHGTEETDNHCFLCHRSLSKWIRNPL